MISPRPSSERFRKVLRIRIDIRTIFSKSQHLFLKNNWPVKEEFAFLIFVCTFFIEKKAITAKVETQRYSND